MYCGLCQNSPHACEGIRHSLGFWIPRRGLRIQGTGLQSLSAEPGFLIPLLVGYQARSWGLRKGVRTDTNIS